LKWFPEHARTTCIRVAIVSSIGAASLATFGSIAYLQGPGFLLGAGNGITRWLENAESGSGVEKALYRLMKLPAGEFLFRRSPRETRPELTALISTNQNSAPLYSLRALEDEQALDFDAAEKDWKIWAEKADDKVAANLDLADFYERRLRPRDELAALEAVGSAATSPRERWTAAESERSWQAWERTLKVVDRYALPRATAQSEYAGWERRYPLERAVYEHELEFDLASKDFAAASALIDRFRKNLPDDKTFPVHAQAEVEAGRGSAKDGLAVFDRSFELLWPSELVKNYCELLTSSHQTLKVRDELRARLAASPDGGPQPLKDAAKLFYIFQQQSQTDAAKAVLADYRTRKDGHGAAWNADELYTLAQLSEGVQDYTEAARYYYALATDRKTADAEQKGLAGLARILLTAPDQPLRVGAGNLALYKSIATMDRGPGYLNGILSLFLNSEDPSAEYANEDHLAAPYFHRAKAAELLADIDRRFPAAPERAELHVRLMEAYAAYGENDAEIREGTTFLALFPLDPRRVEVALSVGDVYSKTSQVEKEFALYQSLLKELAAKADGVPLGSPGAMYSKRVGGGSAENARSTEYAQVLDRYLSRLVAAKKLPDALQVLRGELDRNPQDPGLYEKLAEFLEQNQLNAHQEEVYQRAIEQFQGTSFGTGWYAKLARFYIRQKRNADYSSISKKVAQVFSGTDLEEYLRSAPAPDKRLALEVDRFAHDRFPHDLTFVRNLLAQYRSRKQQSEVEKLLWEHWAESPDLRDQLFELLSSSGRLDAQLDALRQQAPEIDKADWTGLAKSNPAAERLWLESCLWQSRFEQGVGAADALAVEYPADETLGGQASSLYRSLAYFHPEDTDKAVAIEKNLLSAKPDDLETLARIGDIYADRGRMVEAAPYWTRMAEVRPGNPDGYLQSATVFWDYFDFSSAFSELRKGRERLAQPALFGYQAGAIEESQGNLTGAIRDYVSSSLGDKPSEESRTRLLALARRPELRATVEAETAGLLTGPAPSSAAINLRVSVLRAEHRNDDLVTELKQAAARAESFDLLDALSEASRSNGLPEVEQLALRRQIALTTDPVHALELRYQLVSLLEQHRPTEAVAEVDSIYHEHGKVLGVVRSTVDFYWAHDCKPQAVAVLLDSAEAAYPTLRGQLQLEAARKMTDIGDYARSKKLLESLLSQKPLDAEIETALADNYAHSGDEAGLESFYRAELAAAQGAGLASLDRAEKTMRLAQLRRGMISSAALLGKWDEVADQYIELINAYPDDAGVAQEAALTTAPHGQSEKLLAFYRKTVDASPRDARWSIVLARLETALEDYPAAVEAYGKAIRVRPEQRDLYQSKAELEERLHELDEAVADYEQLYKLSYHDPQWMVKTAEARARQGRNTDAVKALQEAWITGRPIKVSNYLEVATRLEQWGMLEQARTFAEQGVSAAGPDLLADPQNHACAEIYARIMARLRQTDAAYTRLAIARQQAADVSLSAVAQQVIKEGVTAITNEDWRKQRIAERSEQATSGFAQALKAMAAVAGEYGTPEEKTQFATWLQSKRSGADQKELDTVFLPAAKASGLVDVVAAILWESVEKRVKSDGADLREWLQLERQRVQLEPVGRRLEVLASSAPVTQKAAILAEAAEVYRTVGDTPAELRTMDRLAAMNGANDDPRYFRLLLDSRPQDLLQRASGALTTLKASRDFAAQFLVANAKPDLALQGVAARSANLSPVWKKAYTGLTGLYLREHTPQVREAFDGALAGDATIGERIAHPVNRDEQLAGEVWFYYGSRFGEYLDADKDQKAESYLEAELEHTPESASPYKELADYFSEAGRTDAALVDYQHSLDLNSDQPAVLDSIAMIEWKQGQREPALTAWRMAVKQLAAEMDARPVPESFWGDFALVLGDITAHGQMATYGEQVDAMLRIYLARNGEYRTEPLLEAAYHAHGDSMDWLLQITSADQSQEYLLSSLSRNRWIAENQLSQLYARVLELARRDTEANTGEGNWATEHAEFNLITALLNEKKLAEARTEFARIPDKQRNSSQWLGILLRLDEAESRLQQQVAEWKKQPSGAPVAKDIQHAALGLSEPSKRIVLRFVYERALEARELTAPNFLGLAAIDLDEKNVPGAIAVLKRLVLVSDDQWNDTDSAASLLETRSLFAEAIPFLKPLADAFPWNAGYKNRFAIASLGLDERSQPALTALSAVASDPKATYAERVSAVLALKGHSPANAATGSAELNLLQRRNCLTEDEVNKPYFVQARSVAALCATNEQTREHILRPAIATAPNNAPLRLDYISSAFATHQDARALVAFEPILERTPSSDQYEMQTDDMAYDNNQATAQAANWVSQLKPEDASRLIWFAIHAREGRHEDDEALSLARGALSWERDAARTLVLEKEIARLEDNADRERQNEARAPKMHAELDQDRVVRARLLPGTPLVKRTATKSDGGGE
jgi:Flp pilus assembly protein TadD